MANTIVTQLLKDDSKETVTKVTILGDGSGEETDTILFDASLYAAGGGAVTDTTLREIEYALDGFSMNLSWAATTVVGTATFSGSGLDDLSTGGTFTGTENKTYIVEIDGTGTPDTFKWTDDGGASYTSTVNITGAAQTLNDGVQVTFLATTGHTLADTWTFNATTDVRLMTLVDEHQAHEKFDSICGLGGLPNNASTGKTGDIIFTSVGLGAGDTGHILLRVKKNRS
jgi:hypothetical protein